jgi:hypothetical protein
LTNFCGVIDPAETVSMGSMTLLKLYMTPQNFQIVIANLQLLLKGISSKNISKANIPIAYLHFTEKDDREFLTSYLVSAGSMADFDDFRIDFLRQYNAKCKTAFSRESEPKVGKRPRVENLVALSL